MASIALHPEQVAIVPAETSAAPSSEAALQPQTEWGSPSKSELRKIAAENAWDKRIARVLANPNPPSVRNLRDICPPSGRPKEAYYRCLSEEAVWRVTSTSAAPVIRPGDIIHLRPYREDMGLQPGNVVLMARAEKDSYGRRGRPWLAMLAPGLPDEPYFVSGLTSAPSSLKGYRILAVVTSHRISYQGGPTTTLSITDGSALPVLSPRLVPSPPHGRPEIALGGEWKPFSRPCAILLTELASLDIREVVMNLRAMEKCGELDSGEADVLIAYALELHEEKYGSFAPEWQTAWEEAKSFAWSRSQSDWDPNHLREIRYSDDTERSIQSRIREVDEMEAKLRAATDGYRTRLLRECGEEGLAEISESGRWRTLRGMASLGRDAMVDAGGFHCAVSKFENGERRYTDVRVASE